MSPEEYAYRLPTMWVDVKRIPPAQAHRLRTLFTAEARIAFRESEVSELHRKNPRSGWLSSSDFQVHHIVPISLGGLPHVGGNLCLVERDVHHAIHDIIDEQTIGLQYGQRRRIKIPRAFTKCLYIPRELRYTRPVMGASRTPGHYGLGI